MYGFPLSHNNDYFDKSPYHSFKHFINVFTKTLTDTRHLHIDHIFVTNNNETKKF